MVGLIIDISKDFDSWGKLDFDVEQTIKDSIKAVFNEFSFLSKIEKNKKEAEISVLLTDNKTIQNLNKKYRQKNKPTNVLSFPMIQNIEEEIENADFLTFGDIIIAYEKVIEEAEQQGKTVKVHLVHMIVHGTLHLLGYTHSTESDANIMEGLEIRILVKLGIENPYDFVG